jgi:hypothetical protein
VSDLPRFVPLARLCSLPSHTGMTKQHLCTKMVQPFVSLQCNKTVSICREAI